MGIPNVKFKYGASALGGVGATGDGIAGLILTGEALDDLPLNTPKAIFSLEDAEALGIDAEWDETNSWHTHAEIADFYRNAGEGSELWIMLVSQATLLADITDVSNNIAKKLLFDSGGRVKIWAVSITRAGAYEATVNDGLDNDVWNAAANAQVLMLQMALNHYIPTRCILPGLALDGGAEELKDLKTGSYNRVQITLHGREEADNTARVGFLLGRYASNPVQRNPGRVLDGDLGITSAFLTDGESTPESIAASADVFHDKGYIFPIRRPERNGYFYNDDPTFTSDSDDFSSFARGRVMDKIQRIAYDVYLDFVNDDFATQPDGSINPGELKRLQGSIEDRIDTVMTAAGEISGFRALIDPAQDVIGSGKTIVVLRARPKAYHKEIEVEIGFEKTSE